MTFKTFKVLEQAELERLYALPIDQLKELEEKEFKSIFIKTYTPSDFELDRPFYVSNGNRYGVVKEENGTHILIMSEHEDFKEINQTLTVDMTFKLTDKEKESIEHNVTIYYLDAYKKYQEIHKVYYNRTEYLHGADPNCNHEIIGGYNMSGIRCANCKGWYCA